MKNYLGEFDPKPDNKYLKYSKKDWAMTYMFAYGQIDGAHHKQWVLDQVARILKGTPVIVKEARWKLDDGTIKTETRYETGEPSKKYLKWVEDYKLWNEEDQDYEYWYDEGIAP